ncbi:MAG: hypothetical protein U0836_17585 [Pirellulales bacterium]
MIYQLYPNRACESQLLSSSLYQGFGLNPAVNSALLRNCPELADDRWRTALAEYVAMLYLWRNPPLDEHRWIGFTSFRQFDKVRFQLLPTDAGRIDELLDHYDVLGWGFLRHELTIMQHAEYCHPGFSDCMRRLFSACGYSLPSSLDRDRVGLFCNYWIVSNEMFAQYMEWSWPLVRWMLDHMDSDAFLRTSGADHYGPLGFVMERLFIAWYATHELCLYDLVRERAVQNGADLAVDQRRDTPLRWLHAALWLLLDRGGCRVVELGSMRYPIDHPQSLLDGRSTLVLGLSGADVVSVDHAHEASHVARAATHGLLNVQLFTQDAHAFLDGRDTQIDLLYLDAWDLGTSEYQRHHLVAYQKARRLLHAGSLLLIDDTDLDEGGKGALVVPQALRDGFRVLLTGRQTLLAGPDVQVRGDVPSQPCPLRVGQSDG